MIFRVIVYYVLVCMFLHLASVKCLVQHYVHTRYNDDDKVVKQEDQLKLYRLPMCDLEILAPSFGRQNLENQIDLIFHHDKMQVERYIPRINKMASTSPFIKSWPNHNTTLHCAWCTLYSTSNPAASFAWFKDGRKILEGVHSTRSGSTLALTPKTVSDFGLYSCKATNRKKTAWYHITVEQLYSPGPPKIHKISRNVLELNVAWNKSIANGGSDILDFMLTLLYVNGSVVKSQNAIKETSFHLKNLRQNTTYIVMLRARNVAGYGESENITVTTLVADLPVPPIIEAVRPGVLSLNISWYSPIKPNSIEVLDYRIQVLDGITKKLMKHYASISTTSLVIKNLKKNSLCIVEIQGRNEVGYGERAKIFGVTLPQGPPDSPTISNPTIDGNNCSLNWTEPFNGKSPITTYTVYIWKINVSSDGSLSLKIFKTFNTTDTFSLKLNLEWNQSYTVVVSAWNKYGEGSSSSEERCEIGRNLQAIMLPTSTRTFSTLDADKNDVAQFSTEVSPKRSEGGDLPRSKTTDHFATLMIFAISSVAITALLIIIVGFCRKFKKSGCKKDRGVNQRCTEVELTHAHRLERTQVEVENARAAQDEQVDTCPPALLPRAPRSIQWEFPKARLQIREVFGQGAFGQVAKGLAFQIAGKANWTAVAVKMLKEDARESDRQDLLSELSVMKKLPYHRHVVRLLGCVTTSGSANPLVIVEFASHGDLLGYLLKSRGLPDTYYNICRKLTRVAAKKLMMFAWQIASGMDFLSGNKVVHRDLAARNVLVANGNICKITDFGMARDVHGSDIYTMRAGGRIPAKWTAYEALAYGIYTTQSDVWSYGIVLYEIFTLGGEPYPGIQARDIARLLERGFRMRRPKHLDKELNSVMFSCWNEDPKKRPTFGNLQEALEKIEKQQTGYMNLQSFADFSYINIYNARKVKEESIL